MINLASKIEKQITPELVNFLHLASEVAHSLGQNLYLVGGIVRDLLLGETNLDLDLAVEGNAIDLADKGHIDNEALLETLNFPNWRRVIERMAENGDQLDQAAQIFIQAGIPEETVSQLLQYAREPQYEGEQQDAAVPVPM